MNTFRLPRWLRISASTIFLACVVPLNHAASAATITVTTASDDDSLLVGTTLRQAIETANKKTSDDVIVFDIPAGKDRVIDLTSALPDLSSNVSIINKGAPITVQRSTALRTPSFPIFKIPPGNTVAIEGLIITRGVGAGVRNNGSSLTMRNCTLHHNTGTSGDGGAIDNHGDETGAATLTLTNCTLSENQTSKGGLYFFDSGGGAIRNIAVNQSSARATATLVDCVLEKNFTVYEPPPPESGGLPVWDTPRGGAIANIAQNGAVATLSLTRCTLEANYSAIEAGAIYNYEFGSAGSSTTANFSLTDCTLRNNSASYGGGIITDTRISGGPAVKLERCTLVGNQAAGNGGGIYNKGGLLLTNCTLSANVAGTSSAAGDGGGAAIFNGIDNGAATLTLLNCTFADNRNEHESRATSVFNGPNGTVWTANSIFVRNFVGDANFVNQGTFHSQGHNLSNDGAIGTGGTGPGGVLNQSGDKRNTDPALLSLADNGGFTQTYGLSVTSPAINAGDDTLAPPTDQRGYARSGISDIGSYERAATTPVSLKPGRLGNIATRLMVEAGDNALIGGFIVTGTEPKKVMVRAIGPSLPFANRLQNPTLELFDSSGLSLEVNDNWVDSPNKQAIIDTTIPPASELESAIVIYLPAGSAGYTAVVRGAGGATGIGVVEVYDLDSTVDSKLANISTRGLVQTGDNVLIAGTIVTGQSSQKVIIRAIGPSLPLSGKLADPVLELYDGNGAQIAANDNWRTGGQEAEITATGVPPSNDLESAIVYQFPSNNASYTAIVRGAGGSTGIAVVEVYALAQLNAP